MPNSISYAPPAPAAPPVQNVPDPLEEGDVITAGAGPAWEVLPPAGAALVGVLQIIGTGSPAGWGLVTPGFMASAGSALGALLTSGGGSASPTYGQIIKAGAVTITGNGTTGPYTINFSVAFPNTIQAVLVVPNNHGTNTSPPPAIVGTVAAGSFTVSFGGTLIGAGATVGLEFIAIGT